MDNFIISSLNIGGHAETMDFEKTDQWHKLLELTYAAWRVADIAIENEFLKNKVKQTAAEILAEYPNAFSGRKRMEDLFSRICSQRAFLSLAQKTSDSRELNFTILKNEYQKIGALIAQAMSSAVQQHHDRVSKKEVSVAFDADVTADRRYADMENVKKEPSVFDAKAPQKQQERKVNNSGGAITERQKKIFQFFSKRKGEKIRLKEVSQIFPDLTDRTMRNDLQALCMKKLVVRSDGHGQASFYKLGNNGGEA